MKCPKNRQCPKRDGKIPSFMYDDNKKPLCKKCNKGKDKV